MYKDLFLHQVKQATRHRSWEKRVGTNIFLGVLLLLIILDVMALGFAVDDILKTVYPGEDPVLKFNSFILYYALIDFLLRLIIQEVPALSVKPYLILPVKKNTLIHYLLSKSLWSFFPLIPLLVAIPFSIKILPDFYAGLHIAVWVAGLFIFFNSISYIALYLKRRIHFNPGIIAILALCLVIVILLERDGLISISSLSTIFFTAILANPAYSLFIVLLFVLAYGINFKYLKDHSYAEEILPRQSVRKSQVDYRYLQKMGTFGDLVAMELRLIFRNRRIKSTVYLSLWMIALAWPFYKYYYPNLDKSPEDNTFKQSVMPMPDDNEYLVSIKVTVDSQPPLKQVCIAGDHEKLGDWRADLIPLEFREDSTWTRTFVFEKGTAIRFKITGADWGNEALYEEGIIPEPFDLTVTKDTVLNIHVASWSTDRVFNMISGSMLIYAGIFFIGMFIITYGQFLFAWEAGYFDLLLVKKIDYQKYIFVKVFLLSATCIGAFLIIAPFIYGNDLAFYSLLVALLYNLGINQPLMVFLSLYNRTRIDIAAGAFSMQGKSGQQMVNVLILILVPAIISAFLINHFGIAICFQVVGGLGLAGILIFPLSMKYIFQKFMSKKYIMGAAFREPI